MRPRVDMAVLPDAPEAAVHLRAAYRLGRMRVGRENPGHITKVVCPLPNGRLATSSG